MLRSGRSGLKVVHRTATTTIFAVPAPRPLINAPARVLALGYASIKLVVPVGFVFLALQGVSEVIKRIAALKGYVVIDAKYERPTQ